MSVTLISLDRVSNFNYSSFAPTDLQGYFEWSRKLSKLFKKMSRVTSIDPFLFKGFLFSLLLSYLPFMTSHGSFLQSLVDESTIYFRFFLGRWSSDFLLLPPRYLTLSSLFFNVGLSTKTPPPTIQCFLGRTAPINIYVNLVNCYIKIKCYDLVKHALNTNFLVFIYQFLPILFY